MCWSPCQQKSWLPNRYQLHHRLGSFGDSQARDPTPYSGAPSLGSHEHRVSSTRPAHKRTTCHDLDSKPHSPCPLKTHIISSSPHCATQSITASQSLQEEQALNPPSKLFTRKPTKPKAATLSPPTHNPQTTTPFNPQHHTSPSISALALFQKVDLVSAPTKPLIYPLPSPNLFWSNASPLPLQPLYLQPHRHSDTTEHYMADYPYNCKAIPCVSTRASSLVSANGDSRQLDE